MLKKTPLFEQHLEMGAKMVPFAGWEMPLQYGSIVQEHHVVRQSAGVFDVSHMRAVDVIGPEAKPYLQTLLANDVAKCQADGQAIYGCMLNEKGGIKDDLITYRLQEDHYRVVVNAATTDSDVEWMQTQIGSLSVTLTPRFDLAMLAIQGPEAIQKLKGILAENIYSAATALKPFHVTMQDDWMVARTGYTGEDGVEILLPNEQVPALWQQLIQADVAPIGLAARDTLRLEAGLNLYGQDMDESLSPLESNLAWTVDLKDPNRAFIGKDAYTALKEAGPAQKLVGIVLEDKGVLRPKMEVYKDMDCQIRMGHITSGTFAPSLQVGIGFSRIQSDPIETCAVMIRGKAVRAKVVRPPFIKKGQANF